MSISKSTEENVDRTQLSKEKKEMQSNLQGKILSLKQKKENQSNLQEKILSIKQKKENQSNLPDKILF